MVPRLGHFLAEDPAMSPNSSYENKHIGNQRLPDAVSMQRHAPGLAPWRPLERAPPYSHALALPPEQLYSSSELLWLSPP